MLSRILFCFVFLSFQFLSNAQLTDTCQGFELFPLGVLNNSVVEGWSNTATSLPSWQVNSGETGSNNTGPFFAANGSQYIYLETSDPSGLGDTDTLNSPSFDISSMTTPQLSFLYLMFGVAINELRYELSDDGGVTWVLLDSLLGQQQTSSADDWKREVVDLSSFNSPIQIRFVGIAGGSFEGDIALDEICIEETPSCPEVFSLFTSRNGDATILLEWVAGGGEMDWVVSVGPEGSPPNQGSQSAATADSFEISGLTPNNFFTAHVRAVCAPGDSSDWQSLTFGFFDNDTCANAIPLSCDTAVSGDLQNVRTRLSRFCGGFDGDRGIDGGGSFDDFDRFQWYSFQGTDEQVTLNLDLEIASNFSYLQVFTGSCDTLTCRDDLIFFDQNIIFFADVDTTYYISVVNDFNDFGSKYDLSIDCTPCINIEFRDFEVLNITSSSAEVQWTELAIATSFEIEFGLAGFTPGTGQIITGTNMGTPIQIPGLTDDTKYDFYLFENCGSDVSGVLGPITFNTLCNSKVAPYCEGFDGDDLGRFNGELRSCWQNVQTNSPDWSIEDGQTGSNNTGPDGPEVGDRYIYLECSGGNLGESDTLTGPVIDISTVVDPELTFFYHMFGSEMGTLKWEISDDLGLTWTTLDSLSGQQQSALTDPWLTITEDLAAFSDEIILRFVGIRGDGFRGDIALDEICVKGCRLNIDDQVLGSPILSGTYIAEQKITSTGLIESTSNVIFDAGGSTQLNGGFEVKQGAIFETKQDGCN